MKQATQSFAHMIVIVVVMIMLAVSTAAFTQWANEDDVIENQQSVGEQAPLISPVRR